jgi:hypothetical protein
MNEGNDRREFVRVMYAEHWAYLRAQQRERTLVLLVYVIILGATLIFQKDFSLLKANWSVNLFLALFSLLGFFLSLKTQVSIRAHASSVLFIAERYSLAHYLPPYRDHGIRRFIRISRIIPKFYLFWFCFFLWVLISPFSCCLPQSLILPGGIYLVGALWLFLSKFDEPLPNEKEN